MSNPLYPGLVFHDPTGRDFRRPQHNRIINGFMVRTPISLDLLNKHIDEHAKSINETFVPYRSSDASHGDSGDDLEAAAAQEYPVLRFYGYFRETVTESNEETYRVRYVRLNVYLEDDTIMVQENRFRNSGIDQGVLLRRQKMPNELSEDPGDTLTRNDFNVGISILLAGVKYRLYGCDEFTEYYFQQTGRTLGEFEQPPDDLFSVKRRLTERPIRVSSINSDKTHLRQFLDFDGKVLRFYAIWDDRKSAFGELRKFTFLYYLVDDKIELRQILPPNCGRDPVSRMIGRTKVLNPATNEPYTDADLKIGSVLRVFGRDFLLYDSDEWTREFLDKKYGQQDWTPIQVDDIQQLKKTKRVFPPYNGFGGEEDSLGYCLSLHPKPPPKNLVKLLSKDGEVIRFAAKLYDPEPQDRNRQFVVAYFMNDDTLAISEKVIQNSGFQGGKFLNKGKYKNPLTQNYFLFSDLYIGAIVNINGYVFQLVKGDEYSNKYMEADSYGFPYSDLKIVFDKIKPEINQIARLKKSFENLDPELTGIVPQKNAVQILQRLNFLNQQELQTILRRYGEYGDFDYFNFLATI